MDEQWKIRILVDKKGGPPKRYTRGTAAKLVASGHYEYVDEGPDDSDTVKEKNLINRPPAPASKVLPFGGLFQEPPEKPGRAEPREIRDMNKLTQQERENLRKKASASPPAATTGSGESVLKNAIARSKQAKEKALAERGM